jgi:5S rRNA maturation endonuclease (ribonuclease M5)
MSLLNDLVRSELEKLTTKKTIGRNYSVILCPFHADSSPSARVLHYPDGQGSGSMKCYACGSKATWNQLAEVLGLRKYGKKDAATDSMEVPSTNLESLDDTFLHDKSSEDEGLKFLSLLSEKHQQRAGLVLGKWRGFQLEFLHDLGFQLVKVVKTGRYYVYLPIQINGRLHGYIKAQINKPKDKAIPSYINSKGGWSRKYGLFPFDQAIAMMREKGLTTIALVEGPRDALRLIRFGIPAVCIMGTQSWSDSKMKKIRNAGVDRIILMMDGDKAGKAASKRILSGVGPDGEPVAKPLDEEFTVKVVRLWKIEAANGSKYDPGNCPTDILIKVRKLLR